MVVMYTFCKYFSVRLGAIVVAVISMSLVGIILFSLWLNSPNQTSRQIDSWLHNNDFIFATALFREFQNHTIGYLKTGLLFISTHFSSCVLLILGSYKLKIKIIAPYLILELARLLILSVTHIVAMMIIKKNILDIGLLILWTLAGGFTLLLLYYMWFCVVSLCQCIVELRRKRPKSTESLQHLFNNAFSPIYKSNLPPNARNTLGNHTINRYNQGNIGIINLPNVNLNNRNNNNSLFGGINSNATYLNELQYGNLVRPPF